MSGLAELSFDIRGKNKREIYPLRVVLLDALTVQVRM